MKTRSAASRRGGHLRLPTLGHGLGALLVVVPTLMDIWWNEPGSRQVDRLSVVLVLVPLCALLVRNRWPVPVAVVCGLALSGVYVLGHHGELLNLPAMVALYEVAARTDRRTTVVTACVAAVWSGMLGLTSADPLGARGGSPVLEMVWPLIPLAFGEATRSRRELRDRAAADLDAEARRRVDTERVELAREMHDVVAHTIASVNVQLTLALAAFESHPVTARTALDSAKQSTQVALHELRGTVEVLRDTRETPVPAPRLDRVPELVDLLRAAGIDVDLVMGADLDHVDGAAQIIAYRTVQEAVTNISRHSTARRVTVSVLERAGGLRVVVTDDGRRPPAADDPAEGSGYGLVGIVERAEAVGGTATHGWVEGAGFRVEVSLPLPGGTR